MKNKLIATKNFVARHKVAIAVVGTAGTCIYLNRMALAQHDEFLREHGLYDQFYTPEV
jgi:hypothetical protein